MIESADVSQVVCEVCRRLPTDTTSVIDYPAPVAADEWVADDRIRGAFIGAALGEGLAALGSAATAEPPSPATLLTGGATQLGLFTADSLIRLELRATAKGIGPAWNVIQHGLHRWAWSQNSAGPFPYATHSTGWPDGWLERQHRLHRPVSGFTSTMAATKLDRDVGSELANAREIHDRPNHSNGRGGLVRVGYAGLILPREYAFLSGAVAASYTHSGADGYLSGGVLARVVSGLLAGEDMNEARAIAVGELASWPHSDRLAGRLHGKPHTSAVSPAAAALIHGLTYGLAEDDPVAAVRRALAEGGTAAGIVAGLLVGTRIGATAIPAAWRVAPDVIDLIEEIAQAVSIANRAWVMRRELPGWSYETDDVFEEHPVCRLLWPRFPGW